MFRWSRAQPRSMVASSPAVDGNVKPFRPCGWYTG